MESGMEQSYTEANAKKKTTAGVIALKILLILMEKSMKGYQLKETAK